MPEFILKVENYREFEALDSFTQGYIEAAFFTECNDLYDSDEWDSEQAQHDISEGVCGGNVPSDSGFNDIAPDSLTDIIKDCAQWQSDNAASLALAYARDYSQEQAGRDYWFTRNGHGVGFWDRDQLGIDQEDWNPDGLTVDQWTPEMRAKREKLKCESLGELLTNACLHDNVDLYRGDDGLVYFS